MLLDLILYTPMYVTFFWAIMLLSAYIQTNKAKHFLGIFMVIAFLLYFKKYARLYSVFDSIYIFTNLAVYPMYYLYLRLLTIETVFKIKNLIHLIPAFIFSFFSIVFLLAMDSSQVYFEKRMGLNNSSFDFIERVHFQLYFVVRISFLVKVLY